MNDFVDFAYQYLLKTFSQFSIDPKRFFSIHSISGKSLKVANYPWRFDRSKLDWDPKGDLSAFIDPVCCNLRWTAWPLGVLGPGEPSLKSEDDPHFLVRLKLLRDPLKFLGWVPDGITAPGGCGPLPADNFWPFWPTPFKCVGEGLGAGLMELEEWLSECKDPVDWYMVDL